MAAPWLRDLGRTFKRARDGQSGWAIEEHRDRLRLVSDAFPPRPEDPPDLVVKRRRLTLLTPPGPSHVSDALAEAIAVYTAVTAGTWRWPDPQLSGSDDLRPRSPQQLAAAVERLKTHQIAEGISQPRTWQTGIGFCVNRLLAVAAQQPAGDDTQLLMAVIQSYPPQSAARLKLHDLCRAVWRHNHWPWPADLQPLRGNGRGAASPEGVRSATDDDIQELRARLLRAVERAHRRQQPPSKLVALDCLALFGLRPQELQGLQLELTPGGLLAKVSRIKRSARGQTKPRTVPAVPPAGAGADCWGLWKRWQEHGLPPATQSAVGPGHAMTALFCELRHAAPVSAELPADLRLYGLRHAFALRLGLELQLSVREAAELMGHSPQTHLQVYGRRLDAPRLQSKVQDLVRQKIMETERPKTEKLVH